ncbi:MAG: hypothetical protein AB1592_09700 [Pseudomonadota bacterium]
MEEINRLARITVSRACGYAAVAISAIMAALSYNLRISFQMGGVLCLVVALVLIVKATSIDAPDDNRTDPFGLRTEAVPQSDNHLRRMVSRALRDAYFTFARHAAAISGGLLAVSLGLGMMAG